jgi:Zn-dependent protease with chaperone function
MLQPWLNVVGVAFDFFGVLILAYEWWIALKAEQHEAELLAREQRFKRAPRAQSQQTNPHQPVFDHMREQQRFYQKQRRTQSVQSMRLSWFLTAFVLIALGYFLQFVGSMPGLDF